MSLETYTKQITTWRGINEDVPEYVKFHDLVEEHKKNILPILIRKTDQTLDKVIKLLDAKYRRSRTDKVKEAIEDLLKFREDQYEDDDELILAMRELRQKCVKLKMTFEEFHSGWILPKLKKQKRMENFEIQALRNVAKESGPNLVENFEKKFKEF